MHTENSHGQEILSPVVETQDILPFDHILR